jgi:ubiquinone/menaquinone biosynthesis C-methylase UbiE
MTEAPAHGEANPAVPRYARIPLSDYGAAYRMQILDSLDLCSGLQVVDVGFGPRTESLDIAAAVGPGNVREIDLEDVLAAGSTGNGSSFDVSGLWASYRLPVADRAVDRIQADRVVRHIDDALYFFDELRRVLRPGGLACVTEPDWGSLVIDPIDAAANQAFNRFVSTSVVHNATFGRQLARLAQHAGFTVRTVLTVAPVLRDFKVADDILGLTNITERAVRTGRMKRTVADSWLAAMDAGPFLASGIIFTAVIEA